MNKNRFLSVISYFLVFLLTSQPLLALDTYVVTDDIVFVRPTPEAILPQEQLHGDEAYQQAGDSQYFFYGENVVGNLEKTNSNVIHVNQEHGKYMLGANGWNWYTINQQGYIDSSKLWKEPPLNKISANRCMTLKNTPVYLLPDRKSRDVLSLYKGEVIEAIGQLNYNGENWIKVKTISDIWGYSQPRYGYISEKDATILVYGEVKESSLTVGEVPTIVRYDSSGFGDDDKKKFVQNGFFIASNHISNIAGDMKSNPSREHGSHYRICDDMADAYNNIGPAVFITTDLYLHTTHLIFDRMLADIEEYKLYDEMKAMTLKLAEQSTQDFRSYSGTDKKVWNALLYNVFFFSVAAKLLDPQFAVPIEVESDVKLMVGKIKGATGREIPSLQNPVKLGEEDFSQYFVRGHYASKKVTRDEESYYNPSVDTTVASTNIQSSVTQPVQNKQQPNVFVKSVNKIKNVFKSWFGKKEEQNISVSTNAPVQAQNTIQSTPVAMAQTASQSAAAEKDDSTVLERYFRAMMWYGRHTHLLSDDEKTLSAILMVYQLEKSGEMARWEKIDKALNKLIGKTDDYTPIGYKQVIAKVYGSSLPSIKVIELGGDKSLQQFKAEVQKSLPAQKIVSMQTGIGKTQDERLKITTGFKFMGQRFTWDAYMFNQLSSPAVGSDVDSRNIPSALDVMYILGSVAAKKEMDKDAAMHSWADQYHSQITKMQNEAKGKLEKKETSYDTWLYGIKTIFQSSQSRQYFTQTEAWEYKNLNTAVSSWTELKHDTILYSKQSYAESGGEGPEPIPGYKLPVIKGYVEPNPIFFSVLKDLVGGLETDLDNDKLLTDEYRNKLESLKSLIETANKIAVKEVNGEMLTDEDYVIIDKLPTYFNANLILPADTGDIIDPETTKMAVIADVATDAFGGSVLEVATGTPNQIFVVVKDAYGGTRIATGYVYSWYQFISNKRMNDQEWRGMVYNPDSDKELNKYKPSWYSKIER